MTCYLGICNPRSFIFTDVSRPMLVFCSGLAGTKAGASLPVVEGKLSASRDRFFKDY